MLLSTPIAQLPTLPQEEHTLRAVERGWHTDLVNFVANGLPKILVALLLAFILQRIVMFFVGRLRRRADHLVANAQRANQLRTVAGIVRATSIAILGFYVFIQTLGALNVPLGAFIASASVIGLGISFGAQSLFKDMLNGLFVLLEDQFSVGDTIKVAGLQGTVEDFTLRCTKLRDGDGTLHIIPNSAIATVSNLSRDYSVASLPLAVDSQIDPDRVLALLRSVAATLRSDAAFKDVLIADPDVPGLDRLTGREAVYPINLRVRANQRDGVLRELRRRLLQAFSAQQIPLAIPTTATILQQPAQVPAPDHEGEPAALNPAATPAVPEPQ